MSNFSSKDVGFILVGGYSLLGSVTTVQDSVEAILQSIMALGDTWDHFAAVGIKKGALSQSGYFDDATGQVNDALSANSGAARVFCYNLEGNTIGKHFIGFSGALLAKYDRVLALEKLHVANAGYNPSGQVDEGQILHALGAETTAGNTQASSVDNALDTLATVIPITSNSQAAASVITFAVPHNMDTGDVALIAGVTGSSPTINGRRTLTVLSPTTASVAVDTSAGSGGTGGTAVRADSDNGGAGYLQVSSITLGGYTNAIVLVQHSADNVTFATLLTFTAVTAQGAECKLVAAGTLVNEYLAVAWSWTGSGSAQSVTFMAGFNRA